MAVRGPLISTVSSAALLLFMLHGSFATEESQSLETAEALKEDKRAPQMYNFGLGKKSGSEDAVEYDTMDDPSNDYIKYGKRGKNRFAFGLGKRDNFDRYSFGLGKRADINRFAFGIGKREPSRFAFGLGKRDPKSRFAFGLGKREMDNELEEYIKRRFSFGLGKRSDPSMIYGLDRSKRSPQDFSLLNEYDEMDKDGVSSL